ncbi:hypothetical protein [Lactobacillus xylocopicola]|uniref:Uncharacterized protein n=1 Tax=Lactobacillus xylocopicola TaxID=2976676 RepID=A0ABM8BFA4_9LACO|nr:hypothetical protein [Lactobacillus xylocopicola]BDR59922.1 hypothetical protein KIM322_01830 [Lactobacillus xylocopicola]
MLKGKIPVTISADLINKFNQDTTFFVSSRLLALMTLGKENEGLITRREYLQYFNTLTIETGAKLIADGQSGFGNELSVWTAAAELGRAGAKYLVLNDQKWPAISVGISGAVTEQAFLKKVRAAISGGENYALQVIPKLEGISAYGYEGLVERIQLLLQLGIQQVIVSRISKKELLKLKTERFKDHLGIALDDSMLSLSEAEAIKPMFILSVQQTLNRINAMNDELLREDDYAK